MIGSIRNHLGTLALVAACALMAAITIGVTVSASRSVVGLSFVAALTFGIGGLLSGNLRLYCLWGLLLTAPIDLSKRFMPLFKMGGESAFRVEASDFFLVALLAYLIRDLALERDWRLRLPKPALWWSLSILLGLVAIVLGPFRLAAAHECLRMGKILLLTLVVANTIVTERQVRHVIAGLFVVVVIQSILALLQFFFRMEFGLVVLGETQSVATESLTAQTLIGQEIVRVGALMTHPNVFAAYLALLLPIAVALLFTRIPLSLKSLCVVTLALGQVALVATGSRSGWVSSTAAFGIVMVLSFVNPTIRKQFVMTRILIVIAAVLVGLALSGYIFDRLTKSDPGAVDIRWRLAGDAWRMVLDRPFFGHGLNSYVFAMPPYTGYGDYEGVTREYGDYLPAVHNTYLLWWSEQGTVGLLIHLMVMFGILRAGISNLKLRDDLLAGISIGAIGGVVAVMIDEMFSFTLRINGFLRVFWLVAALLFAIRYMGATQRDRPRE